MSRRHSNKPRPKNRGSKNSKSSNIHVMSQVRIIGGRFKRQLIPFIATDGLRPTPDRLRETLFNWVQFELNEARVLDLCAGSGVLGFEALSRGASHTTFIELQPQQAVLLHQTCEKLKLTPSNVDIHIGDASKVIPKLGVSSNTYVENDSVLTSPSSINEVNTHLGDSTKSTQKHYYHLVFVDPPYDLSLWVPLIEALLNHHLVTAETLFYVEDRRPLTETLKDLSDLYDFTTVKETKIGQIYASLITIHTH